MVGVRISVETPCRFTSMVGEGEMAPMGGQGGLLGLEVRQVRGEPLVGSGADGLEPIFRGVKGGHHYSKRLLR
jgi:hypothetical protein